MATSTLVKTLLHNSVADSVFKEITTKTGRYYYFLGSVLDWVDPLNPPSPVDSYEYELNTRRDIVLVKEIQPSDVAFIIDRKNWISDTVYDMYDDRYSDEVIGIDLITGGSGYTSNTTATISGGGGTGATANVVVANGAITAFVLTNRGIGFTARPNVIISGTGSGASANAVVNFAYSGAKTLQSSKFYVITDEFNIYKCLDNNNNSKSTSKPTEVSPETFTTSDGYKWKFMGSVPISLRNKFLTLTQTPITTSISNQFYSSGEIKTVSVLNTGSGYTYASITVQGDGYLEEDPVLIINTKVNVLGTSSYTFANVSIEAPITHSALWGANTKYNVGQILKNENDFYEVIQAGFSAPNPPVHTKGLAKNGNTILKFRASGITANANLIGSYVDGLTDLNGVLRDIIITNNGSGYIAPPSITIEGDGSNATATSFITNNLVSKITITNSGKNYSRPPNVIIGTQWTANANVTLNSQVFYGTRLYTISTGGYGNTTAPTHTSGTRTLGNADFTFAGIRATGYARLKYGSGYTKAPNIIITGDGAGANISFEVEKSEAVMYPVIEDGKITRVNIDDGGTGYTRATLTVVGNGSNAELEVNFSQGDLTSLQSTSELLAVSGAIHAIQVVSGGYGYSSANVSILGDGTGATANTTIVNGRISKINILTEGSGYTNANVVITPVGSGAGASARAIISPYGGHGKNSVKELFAKSLAFYSTIGEEKNQGFVVSNDYRQFGIIKDIRNYGNQKYLSELTGSGCWLLSCNVNASLFTADTRITRTSDSSPFLIVSSSSTGLLVITLENKSPSTGDIFTEPSGNSFIVTGVSEPDIDKYSGDILYIDNRPAFTTTEDQAVSLKTVFIY